MCNGHPGNQYSLFAAFSTIVFSIGLSILGLLLMLLSSINFLLFFSLIFILVFIVILYFERGTIAGLMTTYVPDDRFTISGLFHDNVELFTVTSIFLAIALFFKTISADNGDILSLGSTVSVGLFFVGSVSILKKIIGYNDGNIGNNYSKIFNLFVRITFFLLNISLLSITFSYALLTPALSDATSLITLFCIIALVLIYSILYFIWPRHGISGYIVSFVVPSIAIIGFFIILFFVFGSSYVNSILSNHQVDISNLKIGNYIIPTFGASILICMLTIFFILLFVYILPIKNHQPIQHANTAFWIITLILFAMITWYLLTSNYGNYEQNTIVGTWVDKSNNDTIYYQFDSNHNFEAYNSTLKINGNWQNNITLNKNSSINIVDISHNKFNVIITTGKQPIETIVYLNDIYGNISFSEEPLQIFASEINTSNYIYKLNN